MRSLRVLKLISGLTAGMMMFIALLVLLCPMNGMSNMREASSVAVSTLCASDSSHVAMSYSNSMGTRGVCLNFHLSALRRLSEILFAKSIPLLIALIAATIIYFKISKTEMLLNAQTKLTRYKQRYRFYTIFIRLQSREKLLAWLSLFENREIALFA